MRVLIKYVWLFCLGFFIVSCSGNNEQKTSNVSEAGVEKEAAIHTSVVLDSCTIDSTTYLVIQESTQAIHIKAQGKINTVSGRLYLKAPIYFIRKYGVDEVLSFAYPRFEIKHTLMLSGGKSSREDLEAHGLPINIDCGVQYQGLLIKKDTALLSDGYLNGIKCRNYGSDEKDFYSLAAQDALLKAE